MLKILYFPHFISFLTALYFKSSQLLNIMYVNAKMCLPFFVNIKI